MINDFTEILGRGIIAARTGRSSEALKYLTLAAELSPAYARVWLWLAAVDDHPAHKRRYLQVALQVDPSSLVARVLLDRLDQKDTAVSQPPSDFAIFTCPACGGQQHFDPDLASLVCEYCNKIEALVPRTDRKSGSQAVEDAGSWAVVASEVTCGACGARTTLLPERATLCCPFCDSDLVTIQPATPGLISPNAVVPFQLHSDDVLKILAEGGQHRWFQRPHPVDVNRLALTPLYLPFWSFCGRVQILCNLSYPVPAQVYSSTERIIRCDDDLTRRSWFECAVPELLVYAAHSLSAEAVDGIAPFDLKAALDYRPEMLAGWQAEFYQVALEDASVMAHKRMRDQAFKRAARHLLFMEPSHMLNDDVRLLDATYQLVLLPVWVAREGQGDVTLINGQTGKTSRA